MGQSIRYETKMTMGKNDGAEVKQTDMRNPMENICG